MPYLTNLADIARGAGLRVVEQPGWRTRGHGPQTGVTTIVCHHTAGPPHGNAPSLAVVTHGRPGLPGPLSHYVLARDGTVYVIAAGQCWHTGPARTSAQSNPWAIGIEAEATGHDTWPEVQLAAYARLCRALCTAFTLGVDRVWGHKEICHPPGRKIDPNLDMGAFRARITTSGGGPTPAPGPGPIDQEDHVMNRIDCKAIPANGFAEFPLPGGARNAITVYPGKEPVWIGAIYFWGEGHKRNQNQTGGVGGNPSPGPDAIKVDTIRTFTAPDGALLAQVEYSSNSDFYMIGKG